MSSYTPSAFAQSLLDGTADPIGQSNFVATGNSSGGASGGFDWNNLITNGGSLLGGIAGIASAFTGKGNPMSNQNNIPTYSTASDPIPQKDNTTLYIGIGVAALLIAYFLFIRK